MQEGDTEEADISGKPDIHTEQTASRQTNEKTRGSYKTTGAKRFQTYRTLSTGSAVIYC